MSYQRIQELEPVHLVPHLTREVLIYQRDQFIGYLEQVMQSGQEIKAESDTPILLEIEPEKYLRLPFIACETLYEALQTAAEEKITMILTPDRHIIEIEFDDINEKGDAIPRRFQFRILSS